MISQVFGGWAFKHVLIVYLLIIIKRNVSEDKEFREWKGPLGTHRINISPGLSHAGHWDSKINGK